ncbi:MAG: ATP-grasp domain-containing protein [Candidatus Eisenbacteria bacterium]|nr:ATP-grasp domain-containing protein [Candidatus Eisenbacteria bacterium]
MSESKRRPGTIALLGYTIESFEAAAKLGYDFVAVVPPGYDELLAKDRIQAVPWKFDRINERSTELAETLLGMNVRLAVPLYEETVEWAGALNARFLDNPRLFNRYWALRDKAMMKRKAQMAGIRVGVFEEVDSHEQVRKFFRRINEAEGRIEGDLPLGVHMKPTTAAGSVGHRYIKTTQEIDEVPVDAFPCMVESHLDGQEFSCEVFVHGGKIAFLNINEYIHLGYSQLLPPTPKLEAYRPEIRKAIEKLIATFELKHGILHPEYFLDAEGELNFGEVAARIPGGHIFDLIQRAYGFDPFGGQILCSDPEVTEEEIASYFPDEVEGKKQHAGNLLVYPKKKRVKALAIPPELEEEPYYLKHDLFEPVTAKVEDRVGFGNHYGHIDFAGEDADRLREVLLRFEELDYYE